MLQVVFGRLEWMLPLMASVAAWLVYAIGFALMYQYLPDRNVGWRRALQGGAITALLFVLGRAAIAWYLRTASPGVAYGSMGTLVLALVWIYYAAMIVFVGALVTAVLDERAKVKAAREGEDPTEVTPAASDYQGSAAPFACWNVPERSGVNASMRAISCVAACLGRDVAGAADHVGGDIARMQQHHRDAARREVHGQATCRSRSPRPSTRDSRNSRRSRCRRSSPCGWSSARPSRRRRAVAQCAHDDQRAERVDFELPPDRVDVERIASESRSRMPALSDEDVDAFVAQAFRERLHRRLVGDVDAGFDLRAGGVKRIAALAADADHTVAARGELLSQRQADAAVRTRYNDRLAHEFSAPVRPPAHAAMMRHRRATRCRACRRASSGCGRASFSSSAPAFAAVREIIHRAAEGFARAKDVGFGQRAASPRRVG